MNKNKNIIETPKLQTDASVRFEAGVMLPPNTFLNADCMDYLPKCPNGYFDLAIVDPPYGKGIIKTGKVGFSIDKERWRNGKAKEYVAKEWDSKTPNDGYFEELLRVSKNQIIWGGNYYANRLPNSSCWIEWDKQTGENNFAHFELAWTSFDKPAIKIKWLWSGFQQQEPEERIHPTQKPVGLYKKVLRRFAVDGNKILDTHVGSGSSLVACKELGFDYVGFEIDKDYYEAASKRVAGAFRKYELNFGQNEAAI